MKVNFNLPLLDPFGKKVTDEKDQPSTIGKLVATCLYNAKHIKGVPLSPEQKFSAFNLSMKIANAKGEVEITLEEAQLIKSLSAECFMAGIYGNILKLIEK